MERIRIDHLDKTMIKQADVVLLGFSLMWLIYAIGYLELSDFDKADQHFQRAYQSYVRPPFNVCYLKLYLF